MALREGTVKSLLISREGVTGSELNSLADHIFCEMLSTLDCLASENIIYWDVKPANILYTTKPDGQYLFQLGDFGLCNRELEARSVSGSEAYMAPEIY